jgi:hypothetical protein
MEILKSSLKQVPENERVKGRVYGVADYMDSTNGELTITAIFNYGNTAKGNTHWNHWFELPESMLPTREVEVMPEVGKDYEFSDDGEHWYKQTLTGFASNGNWKHIRPIQFNPAQTLSIPAGTKAEQLEFLRGVIATLEGGGV